MKYSNMNQSVLNTGVPLSVKCSVRPPTQIDCSTFPHLTTFPSTEKGVQNTTSSMSIFTNFEAFDATEYMLA